MKKFEGKKSVRIVSAVGIGLIFLGVLGGQIFGEEKGVLMRLSEFLCGMGCGFTLIGACVLIWRRFVGEARAKDSALSMSDERGMAIACKAKNVMAFAMMGSMMIVIISALVRKDSFYLWLCSGLLMISVASKMLALHIYGKKM